MKQLFFLLLLSSSVWSHEDYVALRPVPHGIISKSALETRHSLTTSQTDRNKRPLMLARPQSPICQVQLHVQIQRFRNSFLSFNTRTFNGQTPAPTITVSPGEKLQITLFNDLEGEKTILTNTTNLHVHGLHVSPKGMADNILVGVKPGENRTYEYEIHSDHPSGTFWYHPHHHGSVNAQLAGMMAGALIVADKPNDFPVELQAMDDIVMMIQAICIQNCHHQFDNVEHAIINMQHGNKANISRHLNVDLNLNEQTQLKDLSMFHVLVNGQYFPTIKMKPAELKRLRYINAIPNNIIELIIPGCEMHVLAKDGIYLEKPKQQTIVIIPPGGRADVAVRCLKQGVFVLKTERDPKRNHLLGSFHEHRINTQKILEFHVEGDQKAMELPTKLPKLPGYLKDLRKVESISEKNKYSFESTVWPKENGAGMNFGVNKKVFDPSYVNHTMQVGSVQEWKLSAHMYSMCVNKSKCHRMNHPFHIHSTHFQIFRREKSFDTEQLLFREGEWRDTIPVFHENIYVRFQPQQHMIGKIIAHCHVVAHADIGMAQLVEVVP